MYRLARSERQALIGTCSEREDEEDRGWDGNVAALPLKWVQHVLIENMTRMSLVGFGTQKRGLGYGTF